jgi:hypothetical protein
MALIRKLEKLSRNSRLQTEAACSYNTLVINGEKYLQLNTYGSTERVHINVVSQSLQFDRQSAKQLYDVLKSEFGF